MCSPMKAYSPRQPPVFISDVKSIVAAINYAYIITMPAYADANVWRPNPQYPRMGFRFE